VVKGVPLSQAKAKKHLRASPYASPLNTNINTTPSKTFTAMPRSEVSSPEEHQDLPDAPPVDSPKDNSAEETPVKEEPAASSPPPQALPESEDKKDVKALFDDDDGDYGDMDDADLLASEPVAP
jgi:hypothetical protein